MEVYTYTCTIYGRVLGTFNRHSQKHHQEVNTKETTADFRHSEMIGKQDICSLWAILVNGEQREMKKAHWVNLLPEYVQFSWD